MINQSLLDFIKKQTELGLDREKITQDLLNNGWTQTDIEEGFGVVGVNSSSNVPIPPYDSSNKNLKNQSLKPKKSLFKKIFIIFLCVVGIGFIGVEAKNYLEYVSAKSKYKIDIQNFDYKNLCNPDIPMPCGPRKPIFQPFVLQKFYDVFPSLDRSSGMVVYKPVIYLYPTTNQKVKVELDYQGEIIADYPKYNILEKGWTVNASPDGKIIDMDGKEYSYLFWEGIPSKKVNYDLSTGFVVKGEDTIEFLQNILPQIGLSPKEYNEFIVFWYPKMMNNKYNLIHFAGDEYLDTAPLNINPKPDSVLRVFMVFKALEKEINIKPQEFETFTRDGFVVIEWGGTEVI